MTLRDHVTFFLGGGGVVTAVFEARENIRGAFSLER